MKAFREKACRPLSSCPRRTCPRAGRLYREPCSSAVAGRRGLPVRQRVRLVDGSELEGMALGRTGRELQLRTDDQRIHLLRTSGEQYRRVTTQADWPSMHGQLSGNRYSANDADQSRQRKPDGREMGLRRAELRRLQGTPQVHDGVMYVTNTNTVIASQRVRAHACGSIRDRRQRGSIGNARSPGNNRSVSIAGDKIFMQTDHAHLIALNRHTGQVVVGYRNGRLSARITTLRDLSLPLRTSW